MVPVRDIVIMALLKRMGGTQYLEWDELDAVERPRFEKEGEYLVVRPEGNEDRPRSARTKQQPGRSKRPNERY